MNINGKNGLACLTNMRSLPQTVVLKPLPGLPVVRDPFVDMTGFFKQYHSIKPWLVNDEPSPERERLQTPVERDELNGLYECILCACCSSACPSLVEPGQVRGPPACCRPYRFLVDSRDQATGERLDNLEDPYRLFRCRTILNCTDVFAPGLNPALAISQIRGMLARRRCERRRAVTRRAGAGRPGSPGSFPAAPAGTRCRSRCGGRLAAPDGCAVDVSPAAQNAIAPDRPSRRSKNWSRPARDGWRSPIRQGPEPAPVAWQEARGAARPAPRSAQSSPKVVRMPSGAIEPLPVMSASAALKRSSQNQQPAPGGGPRSWHRAGS